MERLRAVLLPLVVAAGALALAPRLVRVTYIAGGVLTRPPGSTEWTRVALNQPLIPGLPVRTDYNGSAEIQFECGSALRLLPDTEADFIQLGAAPSGARQTTVGLRSGSAIVSFVSAADAAGFRLQLPGGDLDDFSGDSSARVTLAADAPGLVALTHGTARITGAGATLRLTKSNAAAVAPGSPPELHTRPTPDRWTQWSQQRDLAFEKTLTASGPSVFTDNKAPGPLLELEASAACRAPR